MPKQTELSLSYSVGVKANLGNYESADAHISRSEKWDVTDLDVGEIEHLFSVRMGALKTELDGRIETEYKELKS